MAARLNESAVRLLLDSPVGAVGRDLQRRAENVTRLATLRASIYSGDGPTLGIRSGALHSSISYQIEADALGLRATIGTNAMSTWHGRPFSYPSYHDVAGEGTPPIGGRRPWLTGALRAFDLPPGVES